MQVAREVMLKDVDLLKSRGGPAGTAAPQRRRKDDMCSFFKVVVRLANKCEQTSCFNLHWNSFCCAQYFFFIACNTMFHMDHLL